MLDVEKVNEQECEASGLEAEELCLCCLTPVPPAANFCRKCLAPTGFIAGTMPFEQVLAEGFVYHRAVQRPRSLMSVIGIWIIFAGHVVTGWLFLSAYWETRGFANDLGDHLVQFQFLAGGCLILVGVAGIWQTTLNYLRRERVSFEEDDELS